MKKSEYNKSAAFYLGANTKFYNWSIICCFYSALSLFDETIFPLSEEGQEFNSINEYLKFYKAKNPGFITKHQLRTKMMSSSVESLTSFNELYKIADTIRYTLNYFASEDEATWYFKNLVQFEVELKKSFEIT